MVLFESLDKGDDLPRARAAKRSYIGVPHVIHKLSTGKEEDRNSTIDIACKWLRVQANGHSAPIEVADREGASHLLPSKSASQTQLASWVLGDSYPCPHTAQNLLGGRQQQRQLLPTDEPRRECSLTLNLSLEHQLYKAASWSLFSL